MAASDGRQRGQILVVFVGGLLLFLAVVALVIDLGFVFNLRRQQQNAADPGALAAARYVPDAIAGVPGSVEKMWVAACFYAGQNGFAPTRFDTNALCDGSQPGDGSIVTVFYPPSRSATGYAGKRGYVEVVISRPHHSFFAGVIGISKIDVSTAAVAANDTGGAGTSSLVALSDEGPGDCATARLHGGGGGGGGGGGSGSGGVYIFPAAGVDPASGGYVQVNSSCGAANGANDDCSDGANGALTIAGGTSLTSNTVYIQGGCKQAGTSGTINATFDERAVYVGDPLALVRPPDPADLPVGDCPTSTTDGTAALPVRCSLSGNQTLSPGTYYGGWRVTGTNTSITLNPGIYILAGGGFTQTGGVTVAAASGRVLIFSTDAPTCGQPSAPAEACQDIIDFRGSTSLDLRGLDKNTPCPPYGSTGCPFGGLLFWQDAYASGVSPEKDIDLEGNGSLYLEGTIYTPLGDVLITGNSVDTGCIPDGSGNTNCAAVQIISYTWEVGGAGRLEMPYDPSKFYDLRNKGLVR